MTLALTNDDCNGGNMDEVFRALAERATERAEKIGPLHAEITANAGSGWYVVSTHPAHEFVAAAHLSARRFGIYVPVLEDVVFGLKGKRRVSRRMFPGYVFVFVWGIAQHVARIHACPGVARVLMSGDEHPAQIGQDFIDATLIAEARSIALAEGLYWKSKNRRKMKRRAWSEPEILTSSPKCYFSNIDSLDDESRVGVLHKALGLS